MESCSVKLTLCLTCYYFTLWPVLILTVTGVDQLSSNYDLNENLLHSASSTFCPPCHFNASLTTSVNDREITTRHWILSSRIKRQVPRQIKNKRRVGQIYGVNKVLLKSSTNSTPATTSQISILASASSNDFQRPIKSVGLEKEKSLRRTSRTVKRVIRGGPNDTEIPVHKRTSVQYSSLVGPSFINASVYDRVHSLVGQVARLNCIVRNLHNFTVSWIRLRDINLLTSGEVAYSSDKRFSGVNPSRGLRWMLKIRRVKKSDSGKYLCQISTSPPISTTVTLIATESKSEVFPSSEVFLKVGSPVRLICTITGCPYPAEPMWYKGNQVQKDLVIEESTLTFVPSRSLTKSFDGNDTMEMASPEANVPVLKELLVARVVFERSEATLELSGTYSCANACTDRINLDLHVLIGDEETAAMQHINESCSCGSVKWTLTTLFLLYCCCFAYWR